MRNPEEAERELKGFRLDGAVYSWNLLIKYYAKLGNCQEASHVYQQVNLVSFTLLTKDEEMRCKANSRHVRPVGTRSCYATTYTE